MTSVHRLTAGVLLGLAAACGGEPTAPPTEVLDVVARSGGGAVGVRGQTLAFEAVVIGSDDGTPRSDVAVVWTVLAGDVAFQGTASSVSDSAGVVRTAVRLGETVGRFELSASLRDHPDRRVTFAADIAAHPRLDALGPSTLIPGGTVELHGAGFSEVPEDNVVLFSGIRGRVEAATRSLLEVRVPLCLPARGVQVTVQWGTLRSDPAAAEVERDGGGLLALLPGEYVDWVGPGGSGCPRVPGGGGYLVLVESSSTVAGARYPFTLRGLAEDSAATRTVGIEGVRGPSDPGPGRSATGAFPLAWENGLRALEARRNSRGWRLRGFAPSADPAARPTVVAPTEGDERTFQVYNGSSAEDVTAVVRYVSDRAVLYVDQAAPPNGYRREDLARLARSFDRDIHPVVTGAFGEESDVDGNGRVIVLFTPVVNRLTPQGADGFVGGFFFGLDLQVGEGGNDGEVFYAVVPDEEGIHSEPRSRERLLEAVPAVLAHEFQHMVHYNQRAILREGSRTGALWVSEGLAQMAEELVARRVDEHLGDSAAVVFRDGNRIRARHYLADPGSVSLVVGAGQGTLAERGAGWLFFLYLADRFGTPVLGALTRTLETGVANVTGRVGVAWPTLLRDWWSALSVEALDPARHRDFPLAFSSVDLPSLLADEEETAYPLELRSLGAGDVLVADSLASASPGYFLLVPSPGGSTTLRLGGSEEGAWAQGSDLGFRILRLF